MQAIRLVVLLVLARLVRPQDFGAFALASTIIGIAQLICGQGMTAAITQRHELDEAQLGSAFASLLIASIGAEIFLTAGARLLAHAVSMPAIAPLLCFLSASLPLNALSSVPRAIWRRDLRFRRLATVVTTSQIIASLAAVVCALRGFGIWSLVVRQLGEAVIAVIFTLLWIPWRSLLRATWKAYLDMLRFASPIAGSNLMALWRSRLDEVLIGKWLGPEALGYYALARRQLDGLVSLLPAVIGNALVPILSRVQRDPEKVRAVMMRGIGLLGAVTLPVFTGIAATAKLWVPLLLGERWRPAIPIVEAIALGSAARAVAAFSLSALVATGHPGKRFVIEAFTSTTSLLVVALSLRFGIVVVGWSSATTMLALTVIELIWMSRWIPVTLRQQLSALRFSTVLTAVLGAVCLLIVSGPEHLSHPVLRLAAAALPGSLIVWLASRRLPPVPDAPDKTEAAAVTL